MEKTEKPGRKTRAPSRQGLKAAKPKPGPGSGQVAGPAIRSGWGPAAASEGPSKAKKR